MLRPFTFQVRSCTAALLVALCLPACGRSKRDTGAAPGSASQALQAADDPVGFEYPPARWRLATFDELDRTTLWVSHIAIRHEHSAPSTFRVHDWRPDPLPPKRSTAAALRIAEEVAAAAARSPSEFGRLARQYSDDVVSKDQGGFLGGVRASQIAATGFLDVLATLRPGQVSMPFRTPYGFHVLKRESAPPQSEVAGVRIVIGYQGTLGLAGKVTRTRDEARQLAEQVALEAKARPEAFETLEERYSESADRSGKGALGAFSTTDPEYFPAEVAALSELRVGEISDIMDSRFGFEILRRVAVEARPEYAMTAIEIAFDANASEGEHSRAMAQAVIDGMSRVLCRTPARFDELQSAHCCSGGRRLQWGRAPAQVIAALESVKVGQIVPEPVLDGESFLILKRLEPTSLPKVPPRLSELPTPTTPDFEAFLDFNESGQIAAITRSFLGAVRDRVEFAASSANIVAVLEQLANVLDANPEGSKRKQIQVKEALSELRKQLGEEQFARFTRFATDWAIQQMMPPRTSRTP